MKFSSSVYSPPVSEHWMAQAYEMACLAAERDEVPVGAVLVHDGKIIGAGANDRERTGRTSAHAEILALEEFSRRSSSWRVPKDTSLFVTIEPCLMCCGALLWARVDRIFFGCEDTKNAGLSRLLPLIQSGTFDHRFSEIQGGILGENCSNLLSGYFKAKRMAQPKKGIELSP